MQFTNYINYMIRNTEVHLWLVVNQVKIPESSN